MYTLPSSKAMLKQSVKRIGFDATIRHMRNLGIDFIDAYVLIFGTMPRIV